MMNKKNSEPQNSSKHELLSRRAAMKRIAIGLAGVGVVIASGIIGPSKPAWGADGGYSDAARNSEAPYSDAARNWDSYSDAKS